jgi:hypothetical protein
VVRIASLHITLARSLSNLVLVDQPLNHFELRLTVAVSVCRMKVHDYDYIMCTVYLQDSEGKLADDPGRSAPFHVAAPVDSLKTDATTSQTSRATLLVPSERKLVVRDILPMPSLLSEHDALL